MRSNEPAARRIATALAPLAAAVALVAAPAAASPAPAHATAAAAPARAVAPLTAPARTVAAVPTDAAPAAAPGSAPRRASGPADTAAPGPGADTGAPRPAWTGEPLETRGDDHRVREGHVGPAEALAGDANAAADGRVIGATPAHATLARMRPGDASPGPDASASLGRSHRHDELTWVADVGVLLRGDDDGDRFFGVLELTVDVDTESAEREVYAVIELTEPDGTLTLRHATATFVVRGNAVSDRYRVEIELLDNHRAVERNAYIEIRDGWSDAVLDGVSAHELASLASLPLESERRPYDDEGRHPDEESGYVFGVAASGSAHGSGFQHERDYLQSETYVAGYAGAAGPLGALALLALALGRRRSGRRRVGGD